MYRSARNDVTLIAHRLTEYLCSAGHAPSVGVSTSRDKITELHQSFLDCVTALDNKPLSASVGICFYDGNRSLSRRDILWNDEHKFRFYVDMGLEERVSKLLDQLFSNLKASKTSYTCQRTGEDTPFARSGAISALSVTFAAVTLA